MYTIIQQSSNHFNIIDLSTGVFVNRITAPGTVVSGPIVVGNRCTIVVDNNNGNKMGIIYSLPQGNIIDRYAV
jgi:hypothetical protein